MNNNILACDCLREKAFKFYLNFQAVFDFGVKTYKFERKLDVVSDAVVHKDKLSIGRSEGDCSFGVKLVQFHASVKTHVSESDSLLLLLVVEISLKNQLIIYSESTFRHSA